MTHTHQNSKENEGASMVAQPDFAHTTDIPTLQQGLFADLDRDRFTALRAEAEELLRAESGRDTDVHIDLSILAVTVGLRAAVSGAKSYMQAISWESLGIEVPPGSKLDRGSPALSTLPAEHRRELTAAVKAVREAITPAYRFSWLDQWRFVPHAAIAPVLRRYRSAVERLEEAKATVLDNYEQIAATMRAQYTDDLAARHVMLARAGLAPDAGRDEWVAEQLAVLMMAVPRPEEVEAVCPGITKLNQRLASEALREYHASVEERLEIDRLEVARRVTAAQTREEMERIARERETQLEIEREMRASAHAHVQDIVEPLREAKAQIAAMVVERIDAAAAALSRDGALSASASGSINAMVDTFALLDLSGGTDDLAERIERIKSLKTSYIEAAPTHKTALASSLSNLMNETRAVAYQSVRAVKSDLADRLAAVDL